MVPVPAEVSILNCFGFLEVHAIDTDERQSCFKNASVLIALNDYDRLNTTVKFVLEQRFISV